jgi:putative PIG3 family NAD(P)H quinone oxidoreductase
VLIAVAFAGVNRHDCNQRTRGVPPAGATDILGLEVSGRIVAVGSGVSGLAPGEEVCTLIDGGGYAQYALADAALVFPVPASLSPEQAAAVPEALFTAWLNLVWLCDLKKDETVLIHGGASGVGLLAMQLATSLEARVYATAGTEGRCEFCVQHGAVAAFNYKSEDFVAALAEATGGKGADVILDMAGGLYAERNLRALAADGRISHLASGIEPTYSIPLSLLMQKRARITGSQLRPLPVEQKRKIAQELFERIWPLLGREIVPVIDCIIPLQKAAKAHRRMEAGQNLGKILLAP